MKSLTAVIRRQVSLIKTAVQFFWKALGLMVAMNGVLMIAVPFMATINVNPSFPAPYIVKLGEELFVKIIIIGVGLSIFCLGTLMIGAKCKTFSVIGKLTEIYWQFFPAIVVFYLTFAPGYSSTSRANAEAPDLKLLWAPPWERFYSDSLGYIPLAVLGAILIYSMLITAYKTLRLIEYLRT